MSADMALNWPGGPIFAPSGFLMLARTGDDLKMLHIESQKEARVSGVCIAADSRPESVQREVDRACSKLLRELENGQESTT